MTIPSVSVQDMHHRYSIVASMCCCGSHNNCCGGTCCKNDMVFDIRDSQNHTVGNIQRTYARGGSGLDGACCRMINKTGNSEYCISNCKEGARARARVCVCVCV